MWETIRYYMLNVAVAPREGRVSRNAKTGASEEGQIFVAPREGRVSRNVIHNKIWKFKMVAPREGRVSRNEKHPCGLADTPRRAPRGACE